MPSAVGYQPTLATEMGDLQERITSTKNGSITSVQAVYVPADDLTDPALPRRSRTWTPPRFFRRNIAELGIYPAVDPLASSSDALDPDRRRGALPRRRARSRRSCRSTPTLQDIIAILGMDELSEEQRLTVEPCP